MVYCNVKQDHLDVHEWPNSPVNIVTDQGTLLFYMFKMENLKVDQRVFHVPPKISMHCW